MKLIFFAWKNIKDIAHSQVWIYFGLTFMAGVYTDDHVVKPNGEEKGLHTPWWNKQASVKISEDFKIATLC